MTRLTNSWPNLTAVFGITDLCCSDDLADHLIRPNLVAPSCFPILRLSSASSVFSVFQKTAWKMFARVRPNLYHDRCSRQPNGKLPIASGRTNRCTEAAGGAVFDGRAFWRRLGDLGRYAATPTLPRIQSRNLPNSRAVHCSTRQSPIITIVGSARSRSSPLDNIATLSRCENSRGRTHGLKPRRTENASRQDLW